MMSNSNLTCSFQAPAPVCAEPSYEPAPLVMDPVLIAPQSFQKSPGIDSIEESGKLIYRGHAGPEVRWIQRMLNEAGARITVDGKFGPETEEAVRVFQLISGLDNDGIIGRQTLKELEAVDCDCF